MGSVHRAREIFAEEGVIRLIVACISHVDTTFRNRLIDYRRSYLRSFLYLLFRGRLLYPSGGCWKLVDVLRRDTWLLSSYKASRQTLNEYKKISRRNYFSNEHISLGSDDVVFETGGYMGATTRIAAEQAKKVYTLEPSPRNAECLRYNLQDYDNVEVIECAAWNEEGTLSMQYGTIPSKDTLFSPKYGSIDKRVDVRATTITNVAARHGVSEIDFLKVEAEGAEPEIIEGIGDLTVRKISVDCGPERNGESVDQEVVNMLSEMGYSIEREGRHLYATL